MFNLNKHLDSDEKVLRFFRPARRAYIFAYILYVFLAVLALSILGYLTFIRLPVRDFLAAEAARSVAWALLLFSLIMLVRVEWRIWSRRYALTSERLMYSRGIFNETFKSIQYQYITDISFRQNLWDKIINTGSLTVSTASADVEVRYRKIHDPLKVKRMVNDLQSAQIKPSPIPSRS